MFASHEAVVNVKNLMLKRFKLFVFIDSACCVLIGQDARSRSRSRHGAAAAPHTAAHFFFRTHYGDPFPSHLSSLAQRPSAASLALAIKKAKA